MTSATVFQVNAFWDAEAAVWVVTSEDIHEPTTEAESFSGLQHKLRGIIPEILMSNQAISPNY